MLLNRWHGSLSLVLTQVIRFGRGSKSDKPAGREALRQGQTGRRRRGRRLTSSPRLALICHSAPVRTEAGLGAVNWTQIGDPVGDGREILDWVIADEYGLFSHDLDFSTMLALSHVDEPSRAKEA